MCIHDINNAGQKIFKRSTIIIISNCELSKWRILLDLSIKNFFIYNFKGLKYPKSILNVSEKPPNKVRKSTMLKFAALDSGHFL